jgi:hypothetical protein
LAGRKKRRISGGAREILGRRSRDYGGRTA